RDIPKTAWPCAPINPLSRSCWDVSRRKRFNFGEQKKKMQQQIDENEEKVHANVRKKDEEDKPGAKKEFSPSKAKKADSKSKDVVDGNDNVGTGSNVSDAGNH